MTMNLTGIGELDSGALTRDDLAWAAEVCTRVAAAAAAHQAERLEAILRSAEHCLAHLAGEARIVAETRARPCPCPEPRTPERMEEARKRYLAGKDAA
jgi:hypothetical protein